MTGRDQQPLRLTVVDPAGARGGVTRVVLAAADQPRTLIDEFAAMVAETDPVAVDDYELDVACATTGRTLYLLRCDIRGGRR